MTPELRERSYSATAYYRPNCERPNLVLLTEALVREVILESDSEGGGWVAKGVRFLYGDKEHAVKTECEVIICAGSVQSPQLLELSGIGNPEILNAAGITAKINNSNVGENLQEHMSKSLLLASSIFFFYSFLKKSPKMANSDCDDLRDRPLDRNTRGPS